MKKSLMLLISMIMAFSLVIIGCDNAADDSGTTTVAVTGVTLDQTTLSVDEGAADVTLTATITPDNATNKNVTWASTDTAVADVADGVVSFGSVGTATISVTTEDGDHSAECTVSVNDPNLYSVDLTGLSSYSVTEAGLTAEIDSPAQYAQAFLLSFSDLGVTSDFLKLEIIAKCYTTDGTEIDISSEWGERLAVKVTADMTDWYEQRINDGNTNCGVEGQFVEWTSSDSPVGMVVQTKTANCAKVVISEINFYKE